MRFKLHPRKSSLQAAATSQAFEIRNVSQFDSLPTLARQVILWYIMSRWTREELMQAPDEVEQLITGLRFATSTSYEPSSSTYSNIDSKIIPDNHPTDLRTNASPFKSFGISVGTECTLVHCSLYTRCIYRVLTPRELRNQVVNLHCFATISLKPLNF
jgi:hypothetical protein